MTNNKVVTLIGILNGVSRKDDKGLLAEAIFTIRESAIHDDLISYNDYIELEKHIENLTTVINLQVIIYKELITEFYQTKNGRDAIEEIEMLMTVASLDKRIDCKGLLELIELSEFTKNLINL